MFMWSSRPWDLKHCGLANLSHALAFPGTPDGVRPMIARSATGVPRHAPLMNCLRLPIFITPAILTPSRIRVAQYSMLSRVWCINTKSSEERRVGTACGSTYRSGWSQYHSSQIYLEVMPKSKQHNQYHK